MSQHAKKRLDGHRGALTRLAGLDADGRREMTAQARQAYTRQLAATVDPHGQLTPDQLAEAVAEHRREQMRQLSAKSAEVRRQRREAERAAKLDALRAEVEASS